MRGRRTGIPALGQPRAENAARLDPRPRRSAPRRRDDRAEGAAVIVQESKRLERLVRDLLDPRPPEPTLVLHPPARDRPLGRRRAGRDPARCRVSPRRRLADRREQTDAHRRSPTRTRLLQVLSNLIENSLRSTPAEAARVVVAGPARDRDRLRYRPRSSSPMSFPHAFEAGSTFTAGLPPETAGSGPASRLAIVKEAHTESNGRHGLRWRASPGAGRRLHARASARRQVGEPGPLRARPHGSWRLRCPVRAMLL